MLTAAGSSIRTAVEISAADAETSLLSGAESEAFATVIRAGASSFAGGSGVENSSAIYASFTVGTEVSAVTCAAEISGCALAESVSMFIRSEKA